MALSKLRFSLSSSPLVTDGGAETSKRLTVNTHYTKSLLLVSLTQWLLATLSLPRFISLLGDCPPFILSERMCREVANRLSLGKSQNVFILFLLLNGRWGIKF